jgi:hypothetical protein
LRGDFAATFAGNTVFAACQWAALSLIARLGGAVLVGEYAHVPWFPEKSKTCAWLCMDNGYTLKKDAARRLPGLRLG